MRELENIITRASVLSTGGAISADQLRPWLIDAGGDETDSNDATICVGLSLQDMERKLIENTLEHFAGRRDKTAKALGIGVRTLCNKLRCYGYAPRATSLAKAA